MEDFDYEEVDKNDLNNTDYMNNIDTSQYPFPNYLWHTKSATEIAIKTTSMLLVGLLGIYLNLVILFIVLMNKWLWNASTFLIANLAFVDLLTLLFCPWFMLVRDFYQSYVLKIFGCRFEGFMQATLLLVSVGSVMLVCYDRLAAAALTTEARVTKAAVPKLIVGTWLAALALSLPWILKREYVERIWLDYVESYCKEDVKILGVYWHVILAVLVWVPLGIMLLTYGTIMLRLHWSLRKLAARGGGQCISRAKGRAMKITACVLITAAVCRLPYTMLIYWRNAMDLQVNSILGGYESLWFAANFLMYLNSAVNPLIYGFTNTRFKRAMDRTPGVACCKFGSWCCNSRMCEKKKKAETADNNTEKIFVIQASPITNKKFTQVFKAIFHINKDTLDVSVPKIEETTTKPTKLTPLKHEDI